MVSPSSVVMRMASTRHGMRRILKQKGPVIEYIRQAVQSGVYRTNEELEKVWKERADSADDLRVIMRRFRQDIVRGSAIQDYPIEYQILQQHPPVPDPPRTPKKLLQHMIPEPNPTAGLIELYLERQQRDKKAHSTHVSLSSPLNDSASDDYYHHLFEMDGTASGSGSSTTTKTSSHATTNVTRLNDVTSNGMALKSATIQKAYAAAVEHYKLQRTTPGGLSEQETMRQVDELLNAQHVMEQASARQRAAAIVEQSKKSSSQPLRESIVASTTSSTTATTPTTTTTITKDASSTAPSESTADAAAASATIDSIFNNKDITSKRTIEAMMRWSERLQAVSYPEWTIGASTALDHWIARQILQLSEETWLALLEGNDPELLSHGRDIVAVREALFPETRLTEEVQDHPDDDDEEDQQHKLAAAKKTSQEKTVEELLASLGALSSTTTTESSKTSSIQGGDDDEDDEDQLDAKVERLMDQLQEWRTKHHTQKPFDQWSDAEKQQFNHWLKYDYVNFCVRDKSEKVDWESTRQALLSVPPLTKDASQEFWQQLAEAADTLPLLQLRDGDQEDWEQQQQKVADLLKSLVQLPFVPDDFDTLPTSQQVERLLNLVALRPLLDEYTPESERQQFIHRHAHDLLAGVPAEYLIADPDGPITAADLPAEAAKNLPSGARFRLELRPYNISSSSSSSGGDEDSTSTIERTRALLYLWNQHKAGRAHYEERLFQTGRLGLRYSDSIKDNSK